MTVWSRTWRGLCAPATRWRARVERRRTSLCRPGPNRRCRAASRIRREAGRIVSRLRTLQGATQVTGMARRRARVDTRLGTRPTRALARLRGPHRDPPDRRRRG